MDKSPNNYTHAFVRPPGDSFMHAIASVPKPIDVELARRQHAEYVSALRAAGIVVEILESDERFPDSCFMQDPALIVGGVAILNRMGASSRRGETALVEADLRARFETHRIVQPATLEGGDVLNAGNCLYVGETDRTNTQGIEQLRQFVEPRGFRVEPIAVRDYLHLLTVVTCVGNGMVVALEDFALHPALREFEKVLVPREESYAANTLGIGSHVIMPEGYPKTSERLRAKGFEVLAVPMSEFYKADGGVSCLSLIW